MHLFCFCLFVVFAVHSPSRSNQAHAMYAALEGYGQYWGSPEEPTAGEAERPYTSESVQLPSTTHKSAISASAHWGPAMLYGGLSPTVWYDMSGAADDSGSSSISKRRVPDPPIRPLINEEDDEGNDEIPSMRLAKRYGRVQWFRDRKASSSFMSHEDGSPSRQSGGSRSGGKLKGHPNVLFKMRMFG